jgi:hypothetical protein
VVASQTRRQRLLVELDGPRHLEPVRELASIAQRALEDAADAGRPAVGREHPGSLAERRLVADVLPVQARELGDPVAGIVGVEPVDGALHQIDWR